MSALQSALAELRSAATTSTLPHLPTPQSAALLEHIDQLTGRRDQLASALSDQQLDEIEEFLDVWDAAPAHRTRYRDVISSQKSGEDARKLRASTLRALLAEIRRLRGEHPAVWTDPGTGTAYDLTATWRDADGGFWRHAGWVGLPGEPRVPLMLWSAVSQPDPGGIRRMSDLATLRAVIDDCGPLAAVRPGDRRGS